MAGALQAGTTANTIGTILNPRVMSVLMANQEAQKTRSQEEARKRSQDSAISTYLNTRTMGPQAQMAQGQTLGGGLLKTRPSASLLKPRAFSDVLSQQADPERYRSRLLEQMSPTPKDPIKLGEKDILLSGDNYSPLAKGAGVDKPDMTTHEKNAIAIGLVPGTPEYAEFIRNAVMRPQTVVTNDLRQESSEASKVGGYYGEFYTELQKDAANSYGNIARIDRALKLNETAPGGSLTPTINAFKTALVSVGVDPKKFEGLSDAEALNAMASDFALQQVQRTKGAVSNAEMDLFARMGPSLSVTQDGRKKILEWSKRLEERKPTIARLAREYRKRNGGKTEGFEEVLGMYYQDNPFFTEEELAEANQIAPPGTDNQFSDMADDELMNFILRGSQ